MKHKQFIKVQIIDPWKCMQIIFYYQEKNKLPAFVNLLYVFVVVFSFERVTCFSELNRKSYAFRVSMKWLSNVMLSVSMIAVMQCI